jgi:1,4-dihydroxy-2-naphthoate octaprenyltransferase
VVSAVVMPMGWLDRCHHYVVALRPWSFSASLTPVLLGAVLAYKTSGAFSLATLMATLVTVVSVHAAGNLVNTYYDFMRGIDSRQRSDDRTLVDSILTPEEVGNLGMT